MRKSTRRRFLLAGGVGITTGITGCMQVLSEDEPADETSGPEPTETEAGQTYAFEKVVTESWPGSVSINSEQPLAVIQTDGSDTTYSPTNAQVLRTEGRTTLPQRATFEIDYTKNSVENNMSVGLTTRDGDETGVDGSVQIINAEPAVDRDRDDYFTLTVNDGNDWWDAESFRIDETEFTLAVEYDGNVARGYYNGTEIGSLEVDVGTPLYGRVALEDDPDITTGDTVRLLDYSES